MEFFFGRVFPLIFLLFGAGALFLGVRDLDRAGASADWPAVRGTVESSRVESSTDDDGTTYGAEVLVRYEVAGAEYLSNRVRFGEFSSSDPGPAQRTVRRYPVGAEVAVHYDPADPELAVLEPGVHGASWALPGFGLVFLAAGLLMAWYLPRRMRATRAQREGGGEAFEV